MAEAELPDDVELGIAGDALRDRGLDAMAELLAALVAAERARRLLAAYRDRYGVRRDAGRREPGRTVAEWLGPHCYIDSRLTGPLRRALEGWALDPAPKLPGLRIEVRRGAFAPRGWTYLAMRSVGDPSRGEPLDVADSCTDADLRAALDRCHRGLVAATRGR